MGALAGQGWAAQSRAMVLAAPWYCTVNQVSDMVCCYTYMIGVVSFAFRLCSAFLCKKYVT
jgi:hypothetical protein